MAFEVIVVLTGIIVGWIRKGSIWAVPHIRLKWLWLLPIAFVLQHISIHYLNGLWYQSVTVVSYISLLAFCARNVRVPGVLWTLIGTACNFLVMMINGIRMPAYLPAVQMIDPSAVSPLKSGVGKSVAMTVHTHLNFLGDIFPFDIWPRSIISIGDVLFAIGFVIVIQHAMRVEGGSAARVRRAESGTS